MTVLSLAARMARVTALRQVIDGEGGGQMLLCEGAPPATPDTALSSATLAVLALASPHCGMVEDIDGVATLTVEPGTTLAIAMGTVGFVRVADGAGNGVMDLLAGTVGSGMPAILKALTVYAGGEVKLMSCRIRE